MTGVFTGLIVMAIIAGWLGTMLLGSIMAVRGARNWSTILQLCGAGITLLGVVGYGVGGFLTIRAWAPGGSDPSLQVWGIMMAVAGVGVLLGIILFTAGYVGMCAKYGATHRRARELEVLTEQLQNRIQSGV